MSDDLGVWRSMIEPTSAEAREKSLRPWASIETQSRQSLTVSAIAMDKDSVVTSRGLDVKGTAEAANLTQATG